MLRSQIEPKAILCTALLHCMVIFYCLSASRKKNALPLRLSSVLASLVAMLLIPNVEMLAVASGSEHGFLEIETEVSRNSWVPIRTRQETESTQQVRAPRAIDERLQVELFVAEPALVTPTGLTVLPNGDVLVVESHTHFRPEDYDGPTADQVKSFRDTDGDGKADVMKTFFSGTTATMAISVHPSGAVFLATRNEIFRLQDNDNDGEAESVTVIAKLNTPGTYPHNGLSGFAFDMQGHVFFGFGENLGEPYELKGSDGTKLSGGGEGGSIFRCDQQGRNLTRFATGFWNPFHLAFDDYGRLFAVDNDPDWRPPCRLLHIVEGGDYGYRFELGRRGTHPFSSWFGEVPGTLGMVSGTGEAPSGLLIYQSDGLPADYNGVVLSTSWGMHSIERFDLEPNGATFRSQAKTVLKGDQDFRPVSIAMAPDGSIYVSDWVKRSYELHGHGRIWRISSKEESPRLPERSDPGRFASLHRPTAQLAALRLANDPKTIRNFRLNSIARFQPNPRLRSLCIQATVSQENLTEEQAAVLLASEANVDVQTLLATIAPFDSSHLELLLGSKTHSWAPAVKAALLRRCQDPALVKFAWAATSSEYPFVRQAARYAITRCLSPNELIEMEAPEQASQRLVWALILMSLEQQSAEARIPELLADESELVRFVALRWIGESTLTQFRETVSDQLENDPDIEQLFDAYIATLDLLEEERTAAEFEAKQIELLNQLLLGLDYETQQPLVDVVIRRLANRVEKDQVENLPTGFSIDSLTELIRSGSLEATDVLMRLDLPGAQAAREELLTEDVAPQVITRLLSQVNNTSRAEKSRLLRFAKTPLNESQDDLTSEQAQRVSQDQMMIQKAALRSLVGFELTRIDARKLQDLALENPWMTKSVQRILDPESPTQTRPPLDNTSDWIEWLNSSATPAGDPDEGKRLFFHTRLTQCANCHQIAGRGGVVGPDLSHARQLGITRVIESVLHPSREIAPKYEAWTIVSTEGKVLTGVLQTERGQKQTYSDSTGQLFEIDFNEIEVRQPSIKSIMPDRLLDHLTDQEVRDLFAYLMTLD